MDFGTYLYKRRKAWGIPRKELAKIIGVHENTLKNWEQGSQSPPIDKAEEILTYFGDKLKVEIYDKSRFWEKD